MARLRPWRAAGLVATLGGVWLTEGVAQACSTCGCGDPTLTSMGAEKPYAGRLRAAIGAQYRSDTVGQERVDQLRLHELRTDAFLAWAPSSRLFLQLMLPVVHRDIRTVSESRLRSTGLGDAELRIKPFVFQDREFSPRHLVAMTFGAKLPTGPRQRDAQGDLLPPEVQAGTGSVDPILGASYAAFLRPFSFYASAQFSMPAVARAELRASPSLRTTTAVQWQFIPVLAARLGIDTRTDAAAFEHGEASRDSGGFIAFASAEALISPTPDWLLAAALRVPTVNALAGFHHEGPMLGLTVARDF